MTRIRKLLEECLEGIKEEESKLLDIDGHNLPAVVQAILLCDRDYVTISMEVSLHRSSEPDIEWKIYDSKPKGMHHKGATLKGAFESWKADKATPDALAIETVAATISPEKRDQILAKVKEVI